VWQPIADLPTHAVFAFGRPWEDVARALDLRLVDRLGLGGRPYGSRVPDRAGRVYALPSGQHLVVEWHKGECGAAEYGGGRGVEGGVGGAVGMSRGDERLVVEAFAAWLT
jgi:hypothetical protein